MEILVFDSELLYTPIAKKFAEDYNDVLIYIGNISNEQVRNKLAISQSLAELYNFKFITELSSTDPDLVFLPDLKYRNLADEYRKRGVPVFGTSSIAAKFELDRNLGKSLMKAANIDVPPYFSGKIKDAIEWVKAKKIRAVVKPHSNLDNFKTYVPYTYLDTLIALENLMHSNPNVDVTVEQYIDGIEVGIETFYTGYNFLRPINISFEHKYTQTGDLGSLIGEAGTTMYFEYDNEELFNLTLLRIEPFLKKVNYRGDLAIGCMYELSTGKLYGLEFTFRIGVPEFFIQMANLPDFTRTIYRIASGDPNFIELDLEDLFLNGIWYLLDGHQFISGKKLSACTGFPLNGYDPNMEDIYLVDVSYDPVYDVFVTVGPMILVAVGKDVLLNQAIKNSYDLINQIKIVNGYYRLDIGHKAMVYSIPKLYEAGFVSYDKFMRSIG